MSKELLSFQITKVEILLQTVSASLWADASNNKIDQDKRATSTKIESYLMGLKDAYEIMFHEEIEPYKYTDLVYLFGARSIDCMGLKFNVSESDVTLATL